MENFDESRATRVWQRVRSSQPETEGLPELIAGELEDGATYLYLARKLGGREGQALRQLSETEQSHAACLKGIYTLITGEAIAPRIPPLRQEPPERTLRRCYGREMRCLAQYEARADHPEYGPVFARLAQQEREHCMAVLELLGRLKST